MQSEAMVPGVTEEEEMNRLIESHSSILLGMCSLILNDRDLAQDIFQETLVRARQGRASQKANEKAWLIRVVVNLCHDYHRSRWWKNIDHRFSADKVQISTTTEMQNDILELVHQLPYKEKEVVILFFLEQPVI